MFFEIKKLGKLTSLDCAKKKRFYTIFATIYTVVVFDINKKRIHELYS